MTGEELYSMYANALLDHGCGVDSWADLCDMDHAVWNKMASMLTYK